MNRIHKFITFRGARGETTKNSLIDTGANISLIPIELARSVGAGRTGQSRIVTGVHGQSKKLTLVEIKIFFPDLEGKGGPFLVAISDIEKESIIGMDILRPMGISIDAKTGELSIKKEIWEAFKTLAGIGVLTFVGAKILEYLSEEEK